MMAGWGISRGQGAWHVVCIIFNILHYWNGVHGDVTVTRGRTATLPCSVDFAGVPDAVFWMDPQEQAITRNEVILTSDRRFSVDRPYQGEWNLQIQNVMMADEGQYVCKIVSGGVAQDNPVSLIVHYPPTLTSVSPDVQVRRGADVRLTCDGEGRPNPNITWYKNHSGIKTALGVTSYQLPLLAVDIEDAGMYECEASNGISPSAHAKINVDLLFSPEIKTAHDIASQAVGKDTLLQCFVTANPQSTVVWEKDGQRIPDQPAKYGVMQWEVKLYMWSYGLFVKDLHVSDYGAYRCVARNTYGNQSALVHLQEWRTGEIKVISTPRDAVTYLGSNVRLNCSVEDMTSKDSLVWWRQVLPSGEWHRLFVSHLTSADDVMVEVDATKYAIEGHYNLIVKSIGFSDSGLYMCEIGGKQNHTAAITVIGGPAVCSGGVVPVPEGSPAALTCSLQYAGPPLSWDVEWSHGQRRLSSVKEDTSGALKRTLTFRAYPSDIGTYKCRISSQTPLFSAECQTQLVVTDPIPTTTLNWNDSLAVEPSAGPLTGGKEENQSFLIGLIILAIVCILLLIILLATHAYYRDQIRRYRESANTKSATPAPSVARYRKNGSVSVEKDRLTAPDSNDPDV